MSHHRKKQLEDIIEWAKSEDKARVLLLTSSMANPFAPADLLSDLDIEKEYL